MRKVIFAINLTLDGCVDHTKSSGSDDILEYHRELLRPVDMLLYGRKTYELMVPFWPDIAKNQSGETKATNDFAQAFDSVKSIVVFSRTLAKPDSTKTRIVNSNLRDEVLRLKQEPGKDIVTGGVSLPSQLIELGLVDEFRFVVHPIVVGEGRRLLDDVSLPEKLQLRLVESKILESGCVALRYLKE